MRTKYPKHTVNIKTKAQQKEFDKKVELAVACNPEQQRIVFRGQHDLTYMLIFHNFFKRNGGWTGYVFYICRDGSVTVDKNFEVVEVDDKLSLVKCEKGLPIEVKHHG